jgi:hypothetical protein
LNLVDE